MQEFYKIHGWRLLPVSGETVSYTHLDVYKRQVQVSPECAELVETKMIDGVPCLVIPMTGDVEVNGIRVHNRFEQE